MKHWQLALATILAIVSLAGCGGGEPAGDSDAGTSSATSSSGSGETAMKSYSAADLPETGDPLRPLDNGRLVIAAPKEWTPINQPKALVWLVPGEPTELPRIVVNSTPSPISGISRVNASNANKFCDQLVEVAGRMANSMAELPKPIKVGNVVWARHVRLAKTGGGWAAVQSLQTISGGRLYSIDLYVKIPSDDRAEYPGPLKKYRDHGYAVAASASFPKDEGGDDEPMIEEPTTTEEPAAEANPAETNPGETSGEVNPGETNPGEVNPGEVNP